jgi:hypothetical protein
VLHLSITDPLVWLLGSVLGATLVTNVAYLGWKRLWPDAARLGVLSAAAWLAPALFYVTTPLAAWRSGIISGETMGLAGVDWTQALAGAGLLGLLVVAAGCAGWLVYRRSIRAPYVTIATPQRLSGVRDLADAVMLQWHWTFYRALAFGILAQASMPATGGLLVGVWLGLLVAGLEWQLNPFARVALRRDVSRERGIVRATLAVASAGLFVVSRSLLLTLACHLAVEFAIAFLFPLGSRGTRAPAARAPQPPA